MWREFVSVARRDFIRQKRAPIFLMSAFVMPLLYLLLFGQAFNLDKLIPPGLGGKSFVSTALLGAPNYFSYFAVGMVAFVTLVSTLYAGATVLFDKQLGIYQRTTSTPAPRPALFAGLLVFESFMAVWPAFLALFVAIAFAEIPGLVGLSVARTISFIGVAEILGAEILLALMFTSLFLSFGYVMEKNESYFGIVNLLNLPLLFTSNALFPQATMPGWLQNITAYNPASLAVNVMRENLFNTVGYAYSPGIYLLGLLAWAVLLLCIAFLLSARSLKVR